MPFPAPSTMETTEIIETLLTSLKSKVILRMLNNTEPSPHKFCQTRDKIHVARIVQTK